MPLITPTPLMRQLAPRLQSNGTAPPSYVPVEESPPPACGSFPARFRINGKATSSLVDTEMLKRHLRLLGAFRELKKQVLRVESGLGCTEGLSREARWSVFVTMAVHRFELYIERILKAPASSQAGGAAEIPPTDVAMVWHSYMLNPRWYREDAQRIHLCLDDLGRLLIDRFPYAIDPFSYQQHCTQEQRTAWAYLTGLDFDPFAHLSTSRGRWVRCPLSKSNVYTPWVTSDGKGYAQQGFSVPSRLDPSFNITHEVLGFCKFVADIKNCHWDNSATLAGTTFSPSETTDPIPSQRRAEAVVKIVLNPLSRLRDHQEIQLGSLMKWSLAGARQVIEAEFTRMKIKPGAGLSTILGAYTRGEKFSLDLTSAVLRQGTFVDKMYDLGWTRPSRFDADDLLLQRSVARYHAFLDLVSSSPGMFCVPTLDIDLAWHSHQLNSQKYRDDTINLVGRFIDHDDKVEENALSTSYDVTARAWQARFGVPYSICGCPLPDEKASTKLATKLGLKTKSLAFTSPSLGGPNSKEDADATHPSAHSAIYIMGHPKLEKLRAQREQDRLERLKRDEKKCNKGQLPEKEWARRRDHEPAFFLHPIPLFVPVGGCAVLSGSHAPEPTGATISAGSGGNSSSCAASCTSTSHGAASSCAVTGSSCGSGGVSGCGSGGGASSSCGGGSCGGGGCGGGGD